MLSRASPQQLISTNVSGDVNRLIEICVQLGSQNFCRLVKHVLQANYFFIATQLFFFLLQCMINIGKIVSIIIEQGGSANISSHCLLTSDEWTSALQMLIPVQSVVCFKIASHKLENMSDPCLLISAQGQRICCVWNSCQAYNKGNCAARIASFCIDIFHVFICCRQPLASSHNWRKFSWR